MTLKMKCEERAVGVTLSAKMPQYNCSFNHHNLRQKIVDNI